MDALVFVGDIWTADHILPIVNLGASETWGVSITGRGPFGY